MIKTLLKSVREYKRASILAPVIVGMEVVMECILPFVIAQRLSFPLSSSTGSRLIATGLPISFFKVLTVSFSS